MGVLVDLLETPIFTTVPTASHSLPGLLAAMARDEIRNFPALRPHQRPAWHMFLVQLGALAIWTDGREDLPETEIEWRALLLALTACDTGPWSLTGTDHKPAFMQPPAPIGLNWKPVETPDALDLLITSRNHDLKQQIARVAAAEDWVFALVSLQTSEGYGGAGNNGIARMNGGSSSRAMLTLAPASHDRAVPDPSSWWRRDVLTLIALRRNGDEMAPGAPGGPALLWAMEWVEGHQLDLTRLDPWFIEVCRRVRLEQTHDGFVARRSTSSAARTDAKAFKGVLGDPWAPVSAEDPPKSLTLGEGDFTYRRLSDLMFSSDWHLPPLANLRKDDGDCLLVAEALSRGNSKTDGFKSRIVPVPGAARRFFGPETTGTLAKAQIEEIKVFDEALRNALALVAARGVFEDMGKAQYARTTEARAQFDRAADRLFFPSLWDRLAESQTGSDAGYYRFIRNLHQAAQIELEVALPGIPCATLYRPRAEARAKRAYFARLRKAEFQFLFDAQTSPDLPLVVEPEAADV